jgi:hypothetical protein
MRKYGKTAFMGMLIPLLLAGCGGTDVVTKQQVTHVIAANGDDREEAVSKAKSSALEQCDKEDRKSFTLLRQKIYAPNEVLTEDAAQELVGAHIDKDSKLNSFINDKDGYKVIWEISCQ